MAWRLCFRETLCGQPDPMAAPWLVSQRQLPASAIDAPELAASVISDDSDPEAATTTISRTGLSADRPSLRRDNSATSQARGKHTTPLHLENAIQPIRKKGLIDLLPPLPAQKAQSAVEQTPRTSSTEAASVRCFVASSAAGSKAIASADLSEHAVIRGFEPGHISTSVRRSTGLNLAPIFKKTSSRVTKPLSANADASKKTQPVFTLGEVSTHTFYGVLERSKAATGSDNKESGVDESAIKEEDSDEAWEDDDDNEESGLLTVLEPLPQFSRVESQTSLASRRSLITTALHQDDHTSALQDATSQLSAATGEPYTLTPNGLSANSSPHEDSSLMMREQASRPKPIAMATSDVHPSTMSPKTARRSMLTSELAGSLRQNLLWERQDKKATTNAVAGRQQSAVNLPVLRRAVTTNDIEGLNTSGQQAHVRTTTFLDDSTPYSAYNQFFEDDNAYEYYRSGW
ncbi:hypothetical protein AA0119_g11532 [Alternaria tenuissima]|uniref:DUF3295 domain-containing protein n=2 Tax=Alternaria alternata complex TaxID=187734 RepID=A0A4Q4N043_ALTAL|nr:hypothetical protein AA0117_g12255 [Alternaria alternata]RYN89269.1 hypothetical protein AA0119_g11532 [Alternaria tenuissima]RYO03138.1 hypothetical protein AA0121_g13180 [Alternaria tenuissima]RYO47972.1 hypothetical protein AA0116_g12778 [Alternaria tenuissima]